MITPLVLWMTLALAVGFSDASSATPAKSEKVSALRIHFRSSGDAPETQTLKLRGADARQQLLVTAQHEAGWLRDVTHHVTFETAPAGVVEIDKTGVARPLADGTATITARTADGATSTLSVTVEQSKQLNPVNFPNQIVPIFTKAGCNAGGCHGKSGGQNGFRLSLLGFEPAEDYEYLVKEARGRRIFPAAPDRSLLLLKAAAILPHGGGKRIESDSADYNLLVRWIAQGMPYGKKEDPTVARIEVLPTERTLARNGEQQLAVIAHYTDGSIEDVTRSALYEPNEKELAKVDPAGRVTVFEQPGDVGVMVRYQSKVAVFRAMIPLGAPVENLPSPNNFIDELVFKKLKTIGIPPSENCDDATFIRRTGVDIAGRLPTVDETRAFFADTDPAKRDKWIDKLLDSGEYADMFANKWSGLLRNKRGEPTHQRGTYAFHGWLRESLFENKPFDQLVRDLVSASGDIRENPPVAWYRQVRNPSNQLEDVAQVFLGQRLQCAQCHHHPFEKWSQNDYYGFAAFFSQVGRKAGSQPGEEFVFHKRGKATATNKKTNQPLMPAGLGSKAFELAPDDDPRIALAEWMTSKSNAYFAKSLVNRYWKHFFNRGLVDPEDDMRDTNPPTNPELLDALAKSFVESGYDLKQLVRSICRSRIYQLSATPNEHNRTDKQNYSRYYPKRLQAEVLLDAINYVTKSDTTFDGLPKGTRAVQLPDNSFNQGSYFLTVFGRPEMASACECERSGDASLAQSLHLLNSKDIQSKLSADAGRAASLAKDEREDEAKIRELYVMAFAREPDSDELTTAQEYIAKKAVGEKGKAATGKRHAYEDIVWALISTKEFLFNH